MDDKRDEAYRRSWNGGSASSWLSPPDHGPLFLPEKGTIISVAPQGLYQVVNPGTPPFIPAIQEGLMTSIQTHEIMLLTHFNLGGVLLSELHRLGENRLANRLNSLLRRFDDRDLYHTLIWLCWYDLMCAHSMQPRLKS